VIKALWLHAVPKADGDRKRGSHPVREPADENVADESAETARRYQHTRRRYGMVAQYLKPRRSGSG
jgi:hypothetical protein